MKDLLTRARTEKGSPRRRERFPILLLLSTLIHLTLLLLLAAFFASRWHGRRTTEPVPPPEVTLEIIPPPKNERPFIPAREVSEKAPEKAPFESDEHTAAASEQPPEGSLPLPTQQGVSQPAIELENQRYSLGELPGSSAGQNAPPVPPAPPTQQAQPVQQTPPTPKPEQRQPDATPSPEPSPRLSPTAPPQPNGVKLLEAPAQEPRPETPRPQTPAPSLPSQPPSRTGASGRKGYQPETHQTVIRGNISNLGRSSVAAEATPIGRYKKRLADAIGSRWYYYVNERMGMLGLGTVNLSFKVNSSGQVTGLRVLSSNSNESLTDCSLRSIMDAKLPPIPPEVARTLQDGSLEIDYSFTIY